MVSAIVPEEEIGGCLLDRAGNQKSTFEIIEQEMTLNKLDYKVNDSLKGIINIKVLANFDLGESSYIDTLFIKALVKGMIK